MRLISTRTLRLEEYVGPKIPSYAILSHCWGEEEISFQQMQDLSIQLKRNFAKLESTCQLALNNSIDYVWVDTCCIDRTSSAELSEAINSMFEWYNKADVCYAFLHDLDPSAETEAGLRDCKWFTRGWTLQELLAARDVRFYDASWKFRGTKSDLVRTISDITHIHPSYLVGTIPLLDSLRLTHAVVKMSWMSKRTTTKVEDMAYCLLGIFNINMPLLYGEGPKAFRRLQEEILVKDGDLSILAWQPEHPISGTAGVLAKSPSEFSWVQNFNMDFSVFVNRKECSFTSRGLQLRSQLLEQPLISDSHKADPPPYFRSLLDLDCWAWAMTEDPTEPVWFKWPRPVSGRKDVSFGIYLRKHGASSYCRDFMGTSNGLVILDPRNLPKMCPPETIFMHIHRDSLPPSYLTHFPDDPYGNANEQNVQQIGVHFPKQPGLDIVDVANQGLWDASNRMILCTYYELATIVTIRLNHTMYSGMSDILLILRPLHIYCRVQICLLDSRSRTSQYLLENVTKLNDKDLFRSSELNLSFVTSQLLKSEDQKWNISCSTSLEVISGISLRFKVLRVNLGLSHVASGDISEDGGSNVNVQVPALYPGTSMI